MSKFYNEFEKLITELKNAGATIDKKEKLNDMLRTLPSSLYHIGDLVDVLPEQERTVDYVTEKIKMYEYREKEENQNSRSKNRNSNVFKVEKGKDGTCYRCGKPGYFQYECTSKGRNSWRGSRGGGQQQARGGACFQQQRRDGDSHSRGHGRYCSRGNCGYHSKGRGQRGRGGQQRQDRPEPNVFITKVEVSENNNVEVNNCENKLEWILDSGCSVHIVNDDKYFVKFKKLENLINVKVGDGRTLKATSIGDIKTKFVTNYNKPEINKCIFHKRNG